MVIAYLTGTEAVSPIAQYIIDDLVQTGRNAAVISAVTVLEILVSPIREADDALYRNALFFLLHTRHITLGPIAFPEAHEAAVLRARYRLKAPDAMIVATAQQSAIRYLVCNDEEWRRKLPAGPELPIVCYLRDHLPFP